MPVIYFEAATILFGMEQSNNEVKVTIEEVLMLYALVHVPTHEVYTMAQAFQCFLVWPRDLVDSNSEPPSVQTLKLTIY